MVGSEQGYPDSRYFERDMSQIRNQDVQGYSGLYPSNLGPFGWPYLISFLSPINEIEFHVKGLKLGLVKFCNTGTFLPRQKKYVRIGASRSGYGDHG